MHFIDRYYSLSLQTFTQGEMHSGGTGGMGQVIIDAIHNIIKSHQRNMHQRKSLMQNYSAVKHIEIALRLTVT